MTSVWISPNGGTTSVSSGACAHREVSVIYRLGAGIGMECGGSTQLSRNEARLVGRSRPTGPASSSRRLQKRCRATALHIDPSVRLTPQKTAFPLYRPSRRLTVQIMATSPAILAAFGFGGGELLIILVILLV